MLLNLGCYLGGKHNNFFAYVNYIVTQLNILSADISCMWFSIRLFATTCGIIICKRYNLSTTGIKGKIISYIELAFKRRSIQYEYNKFKRN